ncbi:hypothetical protein HDU84_004483 [Entophlyctis sp. JEL0112]|nr:hypothetical protein HDU84_004483 [Entophlyctis sp. JEL0112]
MSEDRELPSQPQKRMSHPLNQIAGNSHGLSPLHAVFSPLSSSGMNTPTSTTSQAPATNDTLADVLANNRKWAEEIVASSPGLFTKLEQKQSPEILWIGNNRQFVKRKDVKLIDDIGCSDARVPAENICGFGPGDLFVHRNIANVVVHTDLSLLSVLQYAVDILKVKHIVVCGHYKCGGCMAAMSNKQFGLIDNWLRNIKDIFTANIQQLQSLPDPEKADVLVELNVAKSVLNLCHTTIVQNAWARKQSLSIHGWVYRLSDGILEDLELCINQKDEVDSIYTYVTHTGIHNAKRRDTSSTIAGGAKSPTSVPSLSKMSSFSNQPVSHSRNSSSGNARLSVPKEISEAVEEGLRSLALEE